MIASGASVVRAAIESLAENFSDGVVAPLLWCAVLGLPGMVFYKAVNTADSMIGHLSPRHAAFGWASMPRSNRRPRRPCCAPRNLLR